MDYLDQTQHHVAVLPVNLVLEPGLDHTHHSGLLV